MCSLKKIFIIVSAGLFFSNMSNLSLAMKDKNKVNIMNNEEDKTPQELEDDENINSQNIEKYTINKIDETKEENKNIYSDVLVSVKRKLEDFTHVFIEFIKCLEGIGRVKYKNDSAGIKTFECINLKKAGNFEKFENLQENEKLKKEFLLNAMEIIEKVQKEGDQDLYLKEGFFLDIKSLFIKLGMISRQFQKNIKELKECDKNKQKKGTKTNAVLLEQVKFNSKLKFKFQPTARYNYSKQDLELFPKNIQRKILKNKECLDYIHNMRRIILSILGLKKDLVECCGEIKKEGKYYSNVLQKHLENGQYTVVLKDIVENFLKNNGVDKLKEEDNVLKKLVENNYMENEDIDVLGEEALFFYLGGCNQLENGMLIKYLILKLNDIYNSVKSQDSEYLKNCIYKTEFENLEDKGLYYVTRDSSSWKKFLLDGDDVPESIDVFEKEDVKDVNENKFKNIYPMSFVGKVTTNFSNIIDHTKKVKDMANNYYKFLNNYKTKTKDMDKRDLIMVCKDISSFMEICFSMVEMLKNTFNKQYLDSEEWRLILQQLRKCIGELVAQEFPILSLYKGKNKNILDIDFNEFLKLVDRIFLNMFVKYNYYPEKKYTEKKSVDPYQVVFPIGSHRSVLIFKNDNRDVREIFKKIFYDKLYDLAITQKKEDFFILKHCIENDVLWNIDKDGVLYIFTYLCEPGHIQLEEKEDFHLAKIKIENALRDTKTYEIKDLDTVCLCLTAAFKETIHFLNNIKDFREIEKYFTKQNIENLSKFDLNKDGKSAYLIFMEKLFNNSKINIIKEYVPTYIMNLIDKNKIEYPIKIKETDKISLYEDFLDKELKENLSRKFYKLDKNNQKKQKEDLNNFNVILEETQKENFKRNEVEDKNLLMYKNNSRCWLDDDSSFIAIDYTHPLFYHAKLRNEKAKNKVENFMYYRMMLRDFFNYILYNFMDDEYKEYSNYLTKFVDEDYIIQMQKYNVYSLKRSNDYFKKKMLNLAIEWFNESKGFFHDHVKKYDSVLTYKEFFNEIFGWSDKWRADFEKFNEYLRKTKSYINSFSEDGFNKNKINLKFLEDIFKRFKEVILPDNQQKKSNKNNIDVKKNKKEDFIDEYMVDIEERFNKIRRIIETLIDEMCCFDLSDFETFKGIISTYINLCNEFYEKLIESGIDKEKAKKIEELIDKIKETLNRYCEELEKLTKEDESFKRVKREFMQYIKKAIEQMSSRPFKTKEYQKNYYEYCLKQLEHLRYLNVDDLKEYSEFLYPVSLLSLYNRYVGKRLNYKLCGLPYLFNFHFSKSLIEKLHKNGVDVKEVEMIFAKMACRMFERKDKDLLKKRCYPFCLILNSKHNDNSSLNEGNNRIIQDGKDHIVFGCYTILENGDEYYNTDIPLKVKKQKVQDVVNILDVLQKEVLNYFDVFNKENLEEKDGLLKKRDLRNVMMHIEKDEDKIKILKECAKDLVVFSETFIDEQPQQKSSRLSKEYKEILAQSRIYDDIYSNIISLEPNCLYKNVGNKNYKLFWNILCYYIKLIFFKYYPDLKKMFLFCVPKIVSDSNQICPESSVIFEIYFNKNKADREKLEKICNDICYKILPEAFLYILAKFRKDGIGKPNLNDFGNDEILTIFDIDNNYSNNPDIFRIDFFKPELIGAKDFIDFAGNLTLHFFVKEGNKKPVLFKEAKIYNAGQLFKYKENLNKLEEYKMKYYSTYGFKNKEEVSQPKKKKKKKKK